MGIKNSILSKANLHKLPKLLHNNILSATKIPRSFA